MRIGRFAIDELHRLVVPVERLSRETNSNESEQGDLGEWAAVIKVRTGLTVRADGFDPITRMTFDPRNFFRRRVLARVLLHDVLRKKVATGSAVGAVDN